MDGWMDLSWIIPLPQNHCRDTINTLSCHSTCCGADSTFHTYHSIRRSCFVCCCCSASRWLTYLRFLSFNCRKWRNSRGWTDDEGDGEDENESLDHFHFFLKQKRLLETRKQSWKHVSNWIQASRLFYCLLLCSLFVALSLWCLNSFDEYLDLNCQLIQPVRTNNTLRLKYPFLLSNIRMYKNIIETISYVN